MRNKRLVFLHTAILWGGLIIYADFHLIFYFSANNNFMMLIQLETYLIFE